MIDKSDTISEFAEKIAKFCSQRGIKVLLEWLQQQKKGDLDERVPLKGMHLPFIDIPHNVNKKPKNDTSINAYQGILKRPTSNGIRLKQLKTISVDLLFLAKPLSNAYKSLYQCAFDTHRCSRSQDLHLLKLKQIYEEKRLSLKDIVGWKLPKSLMIENQLKYYVDQIASFHNSSQSHHYITLILIGEVAKNKGEEIRGQKEHLDLADLEKNKRNYIRN
jgi:hypothetical protein